jgi:CPA2 family monovalent cation:H+ antiporter-2
MLASHALALVGVPMRRVIRIVQDQRDARYTLLRGFFRGADDGVPDELHQERLSTTTLLQAAKAVGHTVDSLHLDSLGVRLVSLRRMGGQAMLPDDVKLLLEGDVLVLAGKAESLEQAELKLLYGGF